MQAITKARVMGYLIPIVTYIFQALTNGSAIPQNRNDWLRLIVASLAAAGIHIGSGTSAGHPDGAKTDANVANPSPVVGTGVKGFARGPFLVWAFVACCLLPVAFSGCHHLNSSNPAVIKESNLLDGRKTVNTIAHGLKSANDVVRGLVTTEPDYYVYVHPKLVVLTKLNEQANSCITAAENGGTCDWNTAIAAIAQQVGDPSSLTTFGFKSSRSQQVVNDAFVDLIAAIKLAAALGGH